MNTKYYDGRTIYFRPLEPADTGVVTQWLNDPDNWRTLERTLPINTVRERDFIEKLYTSNTDIVLGVARQTDDVLIGVSGLQKIELSNRSAIFGILIGREHQHLGYGSETVALMTRYAFEELNLNRVSLSVYSCNQHGIRTYERAGFVREGCSRQAKWRNGRYYDELLYGLLREDYEDRKRTEDTDDARLASMTT